MEVKLPGVIAPAVTSVAATAVLLESTVFLTTAVPLEKLLSAQQEIL
jgi:hypothetical protein